MTKLVAYGYGEKYARASQFRDGYLPTLVDIDQNELDTLLTEDYEEVEPDALYTLPHNARVTYLRRDTGKPVIGAVIVKHFISKAGVPLTALTYPPAGHVKLTPKAYATGVARIAGPFRWHVSSATISRLFVCKSIAMSDRVARLEVVIDALTEQAKAAEAAFTRTISTQQAQICDLRQAVDELVVQNKMLREHAVKQKTVLGAIVERLATKKIEQA